MGVLVCAGTNLILYARTRTRINFNLELKYAASRYERVTEGIAKHPRTTSFLD